MGRGQTRGGRDWEQCAVVKVDHILNRERARVRWGRPKSIAAIAAVAEATKIPRGAAEGMVSRTMFQGSSSLADGIAYDVPGQQQRILETRDVELEQPQLPL